MRDLQQVLHHDQRIGAAGIDVAKIGQRCGDLPLHRLFEQVEDTAPVGEALQHGAHAFGANRMTFLMRDRLVEKR